MLLILNRYAAILLLILTQILVLASSNDAQNRTEDSAKIVLDFPWMQAFYWIQHFPESTGVQEVQTLILGIESGETWALKMLDALVKTRMEIPEINIQVIGIHDECMRSNARYNHTTIRKNNCTMFPVGSTSVITDTSGDSLPEACNGLSNHEIPITQNAYAAVQSAPMTNELDLETSNAAFEGAESNEFTMAEISTIIFFSTVVMFMIACTICDIIRRMESSGNASVTINTLSKFSLYNNARAILSTKVTPDMLPAIHGIRCLASAGIIIGHRFFISALILGQKLTLLDVLDGTKSWLAVFVQMTAYAVETFFVISGFFVAHLFFKSVKSGEKINFLKMYINRYMRITPCLVVLMLFASVLFHRAGSGPAWEALYSQSLAHCRESWWVYLLYSQNLVEDGYMCLPHCWYLAVDMQLFWISPVILYSLHRWPKFGIGTISTFLIASALMPAIILATNGGFNAILRFDIDWLGFKNNMENYYIATHVRACPYIIGLLLGWDTVQNKRRLTQVTVMINWLVAGVLVLFCVWATNLTYNSNFAYASTMETAFAALLRPIWSIVTAWIIYACTQGYAGLLTKFLSLPLFFPVSRLTYCIYLVHIFVQTTKFSATQALAELSGFEMLYGICGDLVLSIAAAFVFNLFVESPVIVLIRIFTDRNRQPVKISRMQESSQNGQTKIES